MVEGLKLRQKSLQPRRVLLFLESFLKEGKHCVPHTHQCYHRIIWQILLEFKSSYTSYYVRVCHSIGKWNFWNFRRPPKPKNFDDLLKGNSKFAPNGNKQQRNNNNARKNGNGNRNRNKPKSNSNGRKKNGNGSRNNRPSNNKRYFNFESWDRFSLAPTTLKYKQ